MKLGTLPKVLGILFGVAASTALLSGCFVGHRGGYGYDYGYATYAQPGAIYYQGGHYQGRYYRPGYYRGAPFVQPGYRTTTVYTQPAQPAYGYGGGYGGRGGVYVGGGGVSGAVRVGTPVY